MLQIKDLRATINDKDILKGINLEVNSGEVHAIMGPNGAGKSTLVNVLAGKPGYDIWGRVLYNNQELTVLDPDEIARLGVFLSFQYPTEIPGVSNMNLIQAALNARRVESGQQEIDFVTLQQIIRKHMKDMQINPSFINRGVNEGFSGGEKKRNEILQMSILEPSLCLLDETDSGLDIDALKIVADGVNRMRSPERSTVLVTHYQRLLDYIEPDFVHILVDGKIKQTGTKELALHVEQHGYENI